MRLLSIFLPDLRREPAKHLPIRLATLSAMAENQGYTVGFYDLDGDRGSMLKLKHQLRVADWNLAVMEVHHYNIQSAREVANLIRKEFPRIRFAAVSDEPDMVMELVPMIQIAVHEDVADAVFRDLLSQVYSKNWSRVPSAYYRTKKGYNTTEPPKEEEDIDTIPFPNLDLTVIEPYFANSPLQLGKEAKNCKRRIDVLWERGNRRNSPDYMVSQVRYFRLKYAIDFVNILDRNFLVDLPRASEFAEKFQQEDFYGSVVFGIRVEPKDVEYPILKKLKEARCMFVILQGTENYLRKDSATSEKAAFDLKLVGVDRIASFELLPQADIEDILEFVWYCIRHDMQPLLSMLTVPPYMYGHEFKDRSEVFGYTEIIALEALMKVKNLEGLLTLSHEIKKDHSAKWNLKCPVCKSTGMVEEKIVVKSR